MAFRPITQAVKDLCERVGILEAASSDPVVPSALLPIADNEADDLIRTGLAGSTGELSDAGHNHPIQRQAMQPDPVITADGTFVIGQSLVLDRWSEEEHIAYAYRVRVSQAAGTGWGRLAVPSIAGFQRPQLTGIGSYRTSSTSVQEDNGGGAGGDGASPRGPYMGKEVHHWSSTQLIYGGFFRRDNPIPTLYIEFVATYRRL